MNSPSRKKCPGCNRIVKGGNKNLVVHMSKSKRCSKHLIRCLGCKKPFVDVAHLNNHQKQQKFGSACIHGHDKMDHVQRLNYDSPIFNPKFLTGNNNQTVFSVEQPFPTKTQTDNLNVARGRSQYKSNQLYMDSISKPLFNNGFDKTPSHNLLSGTTFNETNHKNDLHSTDQYVGVTNIGTVYNNRSSFLEDDFSTQSVTSNNQTLLDDVNDLNSENIPDTTQVDDISEALINEKPNSIYIYERIKYTSKQRNESCFSYTDKALIDLYLIHRKCHAPVGLFDETINWLRNHLSSLVTTNTNLGTKVHVSVKHIPSRNTFVKSMYEKLYSKKKVELTIPKEIDLKIDDDTIVKMTIIDFREVLIDMLSNDDMMNMSNLQFFDHENPSAVHPRNCDVGEIITSDVFFNTHKRLCKKNNDVLFPLVMYNDEICFDSYGKLKLDPFSLTFGRFPSQIRNQALAWRYFGFLHSIKHYETESVLNSKKKLEIYHKCIKEMFSLLKNIQNEGGIPFDLKMENGTIMKVNLILYVQFIMGNTKGHDHLCGRMGCYNLNMKQSVRDCCVSSSESDNVNHICKYRKLTDVLSLSTKDDFNEISFHNIDNALYDLDMGDNVHGILGATCGEPLHIFEMQLLDILSDCFSESLSQSSLKTLQGTIMNLVAVIERQTVKTEFLPVNAFRHGLTQIKQLTGKERHAKIFVIYLAFMTSDCVRLLSEKPAKNEHHSRIPYGHRVLKDWFLLMEDSLITMQWLRKPTHNRKELYSKKWYDEWVHNNPDNNVPSDNDDLMCSEAPAQKCMRIYLSKFKKMIVRHGNGTKLSKFHQNLHFVRNICRHGSVINFDGGRPEAIAKDLAKCPGLRTQKHHKSITIQTAKRYHEDITIFESERIYNKKLNYNERYVNKRKRDSYTYFNHCSRSNNPDYSEIYLQGSTYFLTIHVFESRNPSSSITNQKIISKIILNGSGIKDRIDDELLCCVTNWLWVDPMGGKLTLDSKPKCYTQIRISDDIYNCHPSYLSDLSWNDWVYVNFGDEYPDLPARLLMIIDISGCSVEEEKNVTNRRFGKKSKYSLLPKSSRRIHERATNYLMDNKLFAVVQCSSLDGYIPKDQYGTKYHFDSKIAERFNIERDTYRIIPVDHIVGRALVFINHLKLTNDDVDEYDNTAIVIDHPSQWARHFLEFSSSE